MTVAGLIALVALPACSGGRTTPITSAPPPTSATTTPMAMSAPPPAATSPSSSSSSSDPPQSTSIAPTAAPPATASSPGIGFTFDAVELTTDVTARVRGVSWHRGCPVALDDLRYVRVAHWDADGNPAVGELLVNADVVDDLRVVFEQLWDVQFPIRRMQLVDDFGGDDFASIEADNTSAFNCRLRTGSSTEWSEHSYGRAIDINPIENPYVSTSGRTAHAASTPYLDRGDIRPGMIVAGDGVVEAFASVGWSWGGEWSPPIDYQHFSESGR
jgi:hypothetical protein